MSFRSIVAEFELFQVRAMSSGRAVANAGSYRKQVLIPVRAKAAVGEMKPLECMNLVEHKVQIPWRS